MRVNAVAHICFKKKSINDLIQRRNLTITTRKRLGEVIVTNLSTRNVKLSVYHIHSNAVSAQASFLISWQDKYASHSIALMLTIVTKNKANSQVQTEKKKKKKKWQASYCTQSIFLLVVNHK